MSSETRQRSQSLLSDELRASLKPAPAPGTMSSTPVAAEAKTLPPKPAHPAFVHFPIAFLILSIGLDVLYALSSSLPAVITNNLPSNPELTRASYTLLSLGLLSMVPAVTTGIAQAKAAIDKQGMYEKDGKTIKMKFKGVIAHALANDLVLAVLTYVWYCRRSAAKESLAGKLGVGSMGGAAAYAPGAWMVGVEAVIGGLLVFAAGIGGSLTYNYGFGMAIAGVNKKAA